MIRKLLLFVVITSLFHPFVNAATFTINLDTINDELEETYTTLLVATCLDQNGTSHGSNITFTVDGVSFQYNEDTGFYYGSDVENTPMTNLYDTLDSITDTQNGSSTGSINQTVTVTWFSSLQTAIFNLIGQGDLTGAVILVTTNGLGELFFWTFMMGTISVGVFAWAGIEIMLMFWLLGWTVISSRIQGDAAWFAMLMLALGIGLLISKVIQGRRQ